MASCLPVLERLEGRTVKTESGCWLFPKHGKHKYARINVNGKETLAHRASWELHFGPIPDGLWVLHKCIGNGNCWNPEHLYLGTPKQNVADMDRQGRRGTRGEKQGCSKLTDALVKELRGPTGGFTQAQIAEMYGISQSTLSEARRGVSWKHVV